jgi:tRNA dimethylallyltransferase
VAVDPVAAARIHPNDTFRTIRALEVAEVSGRPLSDWQAAHGFAGSVFEPLLIGLACATDELDARIARRAREMLDRGLLDEVRALARTVPPDAPAWRTVGYREMRECVEARTDVEAALSATVLATRQFAKRQRTWLRRERGLVWRDPVAEHGRLVDEVLRFLDGAPAAAASGS